MNQNEVSGFRNSCRNSLIFCGLLLVVTIVIGNVLPAKEDVSAIPIVKPTTRTDNEVVADFNILIEEAGFFSKECSDLLLFPDTSAIPSQTLSFF